MKTFTGKFMKTMEGWMVAINTGVPQIGDEVRVRKADKSVSVVFVKAVSTESGKAVCAFTERRTENVYSIQNLSRDIRPTEMLATLPRSAGRGRASRMEEREGRSAYEIRNQIGL